jgi:exodeoxyribonuclease VII small subunit
MKKEELKFEDAILRLEEIVKELEDENIPLDEAMKKFEEGIKLSKYCVEKLNEAEKKIEELTRTENGELKTTEISIDE